VSALSGLGRCSLLGRRWLLAFRPPNLPPERPGCNAIRAPQPCPRVAPKCSLWPVASIPSFSIVGNMRARSKRRSKVSIGAMGLMDNIIAVTVYVVVAGLALSELYRFVQRVVSR
jgi:hypothetical protein